MLRLHSLGPFGLPSDSCFVINLVSHLDSLFPCLSRHSPELCVRLCHALVDARQSTEHTILLLSELLCVLVGRGALLCHFFAKSLDGALKDSLLGDQVFILDGRVLVHLDLDMFTLVERRREAVLGRTDPKTVHLRSTLLLLMLGLTLSCLRRSLDRLLSILCFVLDSLYTKNML